MVRWLLNFVLLQSAIATSTNTLVFTHASVIDVRGGAVQRDVSVIINGGRIAGIGKSGEISLPQGAKIVDASGKFLIPGLWDMHVHWYDPDYLGLFIANGVTGARMMWGLPMHHEWRKQIESGTLIGPRLQIGSAIIDGPKPIWPGSVVAGNAEQGREAVQNAKKQSADFIKVYSMLPREAYLAIAEESRKCGLTFEGHVPICISVLEASRSGQHSIEHMTGILNGCCDDEAKLLAKAKEEIETSSKNNSGEVDFQKWRKRKKAALEGFNQEKAENLFAEFRKNQTWQCPTLTVQRSISFLDELGDSNDQRLEYMPPMVKSIWNPKADRRFKDRTEADYALEKRVYSKTFELVRAMNKARVPILAGTDTLNPFCFPGFSLHDELALLVQAGLSPMDALKTATIGPAQFMGREKDLGSVQPGKLADLVMLNANPLENIHNTTNIESVVFGGRLFNREMLTQILTQNRQRAGKHSEDESLWKFYSDHGIDALLDHYRSQDSGPPAATDYTEAAINNLGYQLLSVEKNREAIKILKLNVEIYPRSANVYDSLGEAYLKAGEKDLAITNYQRALELDSMNSNVARIIKELKAK